MNHQLKTAAADWRITLASWLLVFAGIAMSLAVTGCGEVQQAAKDSAGAAKATKKKLDKLQQYGKVDPLVRIKMESIYKSYQSFEEQNGRGPNDWLELIRAAQLPSSASDATQLREAKREGYEIVFGQKLSDFAEQEGPWLMAYDNRAALSMGWVMYADGTIEQVGANQFSELSRMGD